MYERPAPKQDAAGELGHAPHHHFSPHRLVRQVWIQSIGWGLAGDW